ncbi:MAG: hypothetical protein DWQ01_13620 [Planctomycetota bacterium]|nr:MAG: hypothetical protein DWQ01_13620 [Planctomycetota bacterium]
MFDPAEADALQQIWSLPFEFVNLTPELPFLSPAIVTEEGALYVPTDLPGLGESEVDGAHPGFGRRFAYGIAVNLSGRKQVLCTSIWCQVAAEACLPGCDQVDSAWLFRFEDDRGKVQSRRLHGPSPIRPRREIHGPVGLFLDLGMVLTRFDRDAFRTAYLLAFGVPIPVLGWQKTQELRPAMERGDLLPEDFFEQCKGPLQLAGPDRESFTRAWASILTVKKSTVSLVRQAARSEQICPVLVTNTDPILLEHVRQHLGLGDLAERVAASCMDGLAPKSEDASMWMRARQLAELHFGQPLAGAIGVDDIRAYLVGAIKAKAVDQVIHYRHFAQFRYQLGQCGLYLPLDF